MCVRVRFIIQVEMKMSADFESLSFGAAQEQLTCQHLKRVSGAAAVCSRLSTYSLSCSFYSRPNIFQAFMFLLTCPASRRAELHVDSRCAFLFAIKDRGREKNPAAWLKQTVHI